MPRKLQLTALEGFKGDLLALPNEQTMKMALNLIASVRDGSVSGQRLGTLATTADLSDCYKLYFDPIGNRKPRFRLVYRVLSNGIEAVAIEAVSVGERQNLDAYRRAATNLGRSDTDPSATP